MFDYKPKADFLAGKLILVTGATSGIGYAATLTYAKYGATVIMMGRNQDKLEALYDEILFLKYPEAVIHPINFEVATFKDYENIANAISLNFDSLHGALLNAGYLPELRPVAQIPENQWLKSCQINLNSQFFMAKSLLPIMRASNNASLLFTSSSVACGRAYWGGYAATKAAIESLMKTLAEEEFGTSNVRINCINPGGVRTKMRAKAYPGEDPLTLPTPSQIMPAYLYAMAEDSKNLSGAIINAQN